jgi:hypothetical protein
MAIPLHFQPGLAGRRTQCSILKCRVAKDDTQVTQRGCGDVNPYPLLARRVAKLGFGDDDLETERAEELLGWRSTIRERRIARY